MSSTQRPPAKWTWLLRRCEREWVFADCDDMFFSVRFTECQLRYASFVGRRMAGTSFTRCALADFSEADLSQATFDECDLARAIFHRTRLLGADFTTAIDFSLDPELNALEGARFALHASGLELH